MLGTSGANRLVPRFGPSEHERHDGLAIRNVATLSLSPQNGQSAMVISVNVSRSSARN